MKLIVEAGSTKTESTLIAPNGAPAAIYKSPGINPVTDSNYSNALHALILQYQDSDIKEIHYYGSGCINKAINDKIENHFRKALNSVTHIQIQDDLIAVGHGLAQGKKALIGILGTGSNAGIYDNHAIIDGIKSAGYLIGDEGSGYRFGEAIFRRFVRLQLSSNEVHNLEAFAKYKASQGITQLYANKNPRQYLASFASSFNQLEASTKKVVLDEVFDPFIERMIAPLLKKYELPIYLSGSIAFHFQDVLRRKLEKFNIIAASFEKTPLSGLINYHRYE